MRALFLALLVVACSRKERAAEPAPSAAAPSGKKWPGALEGRSGTFDVRTSASADKAPYSERQCAHWTLFLQGGSRFFTDRWPRADVVLTIDGADYVVPETSLRLEAVPPSIEREYRAGDDAPPKVREMLTAKKWFNNEESTPPTVVKATERCLAPSTTYRGEVKKELVTLPDFGGIGAGPTATPVPAYYLVLSPK